MISAAVLKLFIAILTDGKVPEEWKIAKLKPILKKEDTSLVSNYRQISNLNSIRKVFEHALLNRIPNDDFLDGANRHSFRLQHSTTTAALEVEMKLSTARERGLECLFYSMDLRWRRGFYHLHLLFCFKEKDQICALQGDEDHLW